MYCADHVLQLTARLAYSGKIAIPDNDADAENAVAAVRKAQNLVSHLNSPHAAADKLRSIQKVLGPACTTLKCIQDVETRWWFTSMLVDSALKLKLPLLQLFQNEVRARDTPDKPTALEALELTEDDFLGLQDIQHILTPFKQA
jgi:hypothetical protein